MSTCLFWVMYTLASVAHSKGEAVAVFRLSSVILTV